ncbi:MAG: hypothetical protein Tsb0024_00230 [Ruegeria sp.]
MAQKKIAPSVYKARGLNRPIFCGEQPQGICEKRRLEQQFYPKSTATRGRFIRDTVNCAAACRTQTCARSLA